VRTRYKVVGFLLALVFVTSSFTGTDNYHYRRELKGITDTWHRITLPDEMFGKLNDNLTDLRIVGITGKSDTVSVSYLAEEIPVAIQHDVAFDLLNQTKNSSGYFFTFDTHQDKEVNQIELKFKEQNFDWKVTLSGSNDQKEWFTILSDYRIVAVKNELTEYTFTTLKFERAKYRYYRLLIPNASKPTLLSAQISERQVVADAYRQYAVKRTSVKNNKKEKQTMIDLELPNTVPVSLMHFITTDKFDFYRPVIVQYLSDSTKTLNGWEYNYSNLYTGVISSVNSIDLPFTSTFANRLRVIIENGDNEPLHPDSFVVKGNRRLLYARFTQPATYYLYYGNKGATQPDYDIAKFKDKIPADSKELTLGPEEAIAQPAAIKVKPLFENKAWLWGIMLLIIALLGWFSVKMMRGKA
jgi:hypothetical protein